MCIVIGWNGDWIGWVVVWEDYVLGVGKKMFVCCVVFVMCVLIVVLVVVVLCVISVLMIVWCLCYVDSSSLCW